LSVPRASRPSMPGYGIVGPDEGRGLLPWSWADERLTASHDYSGAIAERVARVNDKYASEITVEFMDPAVNAASRFRPRWVLGLDDKEFTKSPTRWQFEGRPHT
jgi:hypothetical protein